MLLASSQRDFPHALDPLIAECDQAGMKFSTKKTDVLCLSMKQSQCTLKVSGITMQQVVKLK